ncbi:MAG: hypothetical protein VCC04_04250 [Myxococcota bacterium]
MTARAVARRVAWLYQDDLLRDVGVLQVSSGWRDALGATRSLKIGPATPRSETDAFVLGLARARADAIVTTGRILREEPSTRHALGGAEALDLAAWRRDLLGRPDPPRSVVLTSGREIDWSHPLFRGPRPVLVFTGERAAKELGDAARAVGAQLIAHPEPSLGALLSYLRDLPDMRTVLLEVGPDTVRSVYTTPSPVQEWMLSVHLADQIPQAVLGAPWPGPEQRRAAGLELLSERRVEEEDGSVWLFQRFA